MKKFLLKIWYTILYQFEQHHYKIPMWWYEQLPFDKQPERVKRITIAKDVILQLKASRYHAKGGNYVTIEWKENYKGSVKENFDTLKDCRVCAIGGCFLSIVRFKNNVMFDEITEVGAYRFANNDKFKQILTSVFPVRQLILIENAFEFGDIGQQPIFGTVEERNSVSEKSKRQAHLFGRQYPNNKDRLIAIMENIINNNGFFKP